MSDGIVNYSVRRGDNLSTIARQFKLPDYRAIYEANKDVLKDGPGHVPEGIVLKIPVGKKVPAQPISLAAPSADTYLVRPGDTLMGIADAKLGSPSRWVELRDWNVDIVKDPRRLPIGATLRLTPPAGAAPAPAATSPAPDAPPSADGEARMPSQRELDWVNQVSRYIVSGGKVNADYMLAFQDIVARQIDAQMAQQRKAEARPGVVTTAGVTLEDRSKEAPVDQLRSMAAKYGVEWNPDETPDKQQAKIVRAAVRAKAKQLGIPEDVAFGISGLESAGWRMWSNFDKGSVVVGRNKKSKSSDWGVMQINDHAHRHAFPRARLDLEFNIEYGLRFLASLRGRFEGGNLGHGFGDWDATMAAYNLGSPPSGPKGLSKAARYLSLADTWRDKAIAERIKGST